MVLLLLHGRSQRVHLRHREVIRHPGVALQVLRNLARDNLAEAPELQAPGLADDLYCVRRWHRAAAARPPGAQPLHEPAPAAAGSSGLYSASVAVQPLRLLEGVEHAGPRGPRLLHNLPGERRVRIALLLLLAVRRPQVKARAAPPLHAVLVLRVPLLLRVDSGGQLPRPAAAPGGRRAGRQLPCLQALHILARVAAGGRAPGRRRRGLPKVAQDRRPAAGRPRRHPLHRGEGLLRLPRVPVAAAALPALRLGQQPARGARVPLPKVEHGEGGQPVAAGSPRLLVERLQALREVEVHHHAHVGLVDAHAKGDGGRHDGRAAAGPVWETAHAPPSWDYGPI
mmetsp:Transcript_13468/g.33934  ORF Transcript_13468/g.33934 Transcript_13468/m.33934 type:complete len:340 (-) Transcript_13468:336-1355(-)